MQLLIIIAVIVTLYLIFRSKDHVQVDRQEIQKNVRQDVQTASTYTRSHSASALSKSSSFAERLAAKIEPNNNDES